MNPLLIDVTLEKILAFLPDDTVQQCRGVCTLWKEIAKRILYNRHTITVNEEKDIKVLIERLKDPDYRIFDLHVTDINLSCRPFLTLINKILPTLTYLSLQDNKIESVKAFQALMRLICPNLTKFDLGTVKTLPNNGHRYIKYVPVPIAAEDESEAMVFPKMRHFEYISYNDWSHEATMLSDVVRAFPNLRILFIAHMCPENPKNLKGLELPHLKKLVLRNMPQATNPNAYGIDESMNCPCCMDEVLQGEEPLARRHRRLKELKLGAIQAHHLQIIEELKLKLESLDLWNIHRGLDPDYLKSFIQSQADTLTNLALMQHSDAPDTVELCKLPAPCPFPMNLPNLKRLTVCRPFIKNLNHVFNSCPNLEEVIFEFYQDADWSKILTNSFVPRNQVKFIQISSIDSKSFAKVARMFPSLTHLEINGVDDSHLKTIFEKFPLLEKLTASDGPTSKMTEEGFTGMTLKSLSQLECLRKKECVLKRFAKHQINSLGNLPRIGNLKHLYLLDLEFNHFPFSKIMVKWGFSLCPSLNFLAIKGEMKDAIANAKLDVKKFMAGEGFVYIDSKGRIDPETALYVRSFNNDYEDSDSSDEWESLSSDSSDD